MNCKDFLMRLSGAVGVSGRESSVVALAAEELRALGEVSISPLGDLICTIRRPEEGQKNFMLDAHVDEIGMIVTWIDDEGFLKVSPVGGFDRSLLLASQVSVHTKQGDLPGVICSIPPHLQSGEAKNPKFEDIYIDIGYSREEAEKRVQPGDIVTFVTPTREMHGGFITGKAIDNRSSCVAVMRAAELLKNEDKPYGLSVTLTTREEVGGMGAQAVAYTVNPTHAITVDVGFGWTPDCKKEQCGTFGAGPIVAFGSLLDAEIYTYIYCCPGRRNSLSDRSHGRRDRHQRRQYSHYPGRPWKTGILSIPQGYKHTPVEKILPEDIENTARLLAAYVKKEGNRK